MVTNAVPSSVLSSDSERKQSAEFDAARTAAAKLNPVFDRIVVYRRKERETRGGIVLPDNARGKSARGVVVACGPGQRQPDGQPSGRPAVNVGNEILFTQYSGTDVEVDGHEFVILTGDDVLAIMGG